MRRAEVYEIPMVPHDAETHDHDRIELERVLFVAFDAIEEADIAFVRVRIEDPTPIGFIVRRDAHGVVELVLTMERPKGTLLTPIAFSHALLRRMLLILSLRDELKTNDELRQALDGVSLG